MSLVPYLTKQKNADPEGNVIKLRMTLTKEWSKDAGKYEFILVSVFFYYRRLE
jgi:hypothetical protein